MEEEKKALAGDIRDKYLEAKALGFDVKALRQIVRLRKKSATERTEEDAILEVYLHALGMLDDEPAEADDRRGVRRRDAGSARSRHRMIAIETEKERAPRPDSALGRGAHGKS